MRIFAFSNPNWCTFAVVLVLLQLVPLCARADVRPLSRLMLTNLQASNAIGEGLATEDYTGVESAARELEGTARELLGWDASRLGFKPNNRPEFERYIKLQQEIAGRLVQAARQRNQSAIVGGLDEMLGGACLGCHRDFRDREGILKGSTIFMTSFINTWKEINRGLLLNDLTLVGRSARTLVATGQVMSWDPVLQASFHIAGPARRNKFREYLNRLVGAAGRVEDAAIRGETDEVRKSLTDMWNAGCLACHREFR